MKFSTILAASLVAAVSAQGDQRILATLAEKWNLTDPTFAYDANTFNLTFPVTNFISTGMSKFSLWTAPECQTDGGTPLTDRTDIWLTSPRLLENQALKSGNSTDSGAFTGRNATIIATFNPQNVSKSVIYRDTSANGQASAEIRFCMRFGLWTTGMVTTPVEVNFLETLVTLRVNLTDGFNIGQITAEPKDRLVRTANQAYEVEGYECKDDADFTKLTAGEMSRPRNQGEIINVCVKPAKEAETDGIYMRSIDQFTFIRDSTIRQSAIEKNQAAGNLLTTYTPENCRGASVCRFSTILFAQFYATTGKVDGQGTASMQFGNSKNRRQLRADRDLQEADSAGAAEFDLNFEVAQAEAQSDSGASSMGMAVSLATVAALAALL